MNRPDVDAAVVSGLSRGLLGEGLLALWGGMDPAQEEGFNDWYTHEHLPERIAVPGFLRARRYVSDVAGERAADWKYFTIYETEKLGTLTSDAYLHMLDNPTERTRQYLPLFSTMSRTACRVVHTHGSGVGGSVAFVEFGPQPGGADRLRRWVVDEFAAEAYGRSGYLGVHLCEADAAATGVRDRTEVYRDVPTTAGRWLLILEGAWLDGAAERARIVRDADRLRAHGAADDCAIESYRLLSYLARD